MPHLGPALTGVVLILGAVLSGIAIIAWGDVLLAAREIALNTRRADSANKSQYRSLEAVATLNNIVGGLVILGGVILGGMLLVGVRL